MKNLNLSVEPYKSDHVYKATDRVVLNCSVDVRSVMVYSELL